jgi:hypothetical protein
VRTRILVLAAIRPLLSPCPRWRGCWAGAGGSFSQFGEFGDAAAGCPGQPAGQGVLAFFSFELERGPQPFLEQISAPEVWMGFPGPGELGFLAAGQALGVFPRQPDL